MRWRCKDQAQVNFHNNNVRVRYDLDTMSTQSDKPDDDRNIRYELPPPLSSWASNLTEKEFQDPASFRRVLRKNLPRLLGISTESLLRVEQLNSFGWIPSCIY